MPASSLTAFSAQQPDLTTLTVYLVLVFALMAALLLLTGLLGEKKGSVVKLAPYESGMDPSGNARFPYPAPFYLVAIFFLIFDVEAAYIFSWAIAFAQLGWAGWLGITFFIFVLLISLLYLWKKRGLEWAMAKQPQ